MICATKAEAEVLYAHMVSNVVMKFGCMEQINNSTIVLQTMFTFSYGHDMELALDIHDFRVFSEEHSDSSLGHLSGHQGSVDLYILNPGTFDWATNRSARFLLLAYSELMSVRIHHFLCIID
jgi:hypothetical protein